MLFLKVAKCFFKKAICVGKVELFLSYAKIIFILFLLSSVALAEKSKTDCSYLLTRDLFYIKRTQTLLEKKLEDGTILSVIDLIPTQGHSDKSRKWAYQYRSFKEGIYSNRLDKYKSDATDKNMDRFQKVSPELENRSILILNTLDHLGNEKPEFRAGARVVISKNKDESLPYELDLNVERPYPDLQAAEVGQLTVQEVGGSRTSQMARTVKVIQAALMAITFHPEVEVVFVHTSRVHVRLYTMMGLVPKKVLEFDPLNHVMIFSREQLDEYLAPHALKTIKPN